MVRGQSHLDPYRNAEWRTNNTKQKDDKTYVVALFFSGKKGLDKWLDIMDYFKMKYAVYDSRDITPQCPLFGFENRKKVQSSCQKVIE